MHGASNVKEIKSMLTNNFKKILEAARTMNNPDACYHKISHGFKCACIENEPLVEDSIFLSLRKPPSY